MKLGVEVGGGGRFCVAHTVTQPKTHKLCHTASYTHTHTHTPCHTAWHTHTVSHILSHTHTVSHSLAHTYGVTHPGHPHQDAHSLLFPYLKQKAPPSRFGTDRSIPSQVPFCIRPSDLLSWEKLCPSTPQETCGDI